MRAEHIEFLVEEPSMEAFLMEILPTIIGEQSTFSIHVHQGKTDLLKSLSARLRGYAKWLPKNTRIVVLVDRDADDCRYLKQRMETATLDAALTSRTSTGTAFWQVVNRVAIEELEAWFFGEWKGVRRAYPRLSATVPNQAAYRHSDAIAGGTWEAFERVLRRSGYFTGGLRKIEVAREVGKHFRQSECSSPSFAAFRDALTEATT